MPTCSSGPRFRPRWSQRSTRFQCWHICHLCYYNIGYCKSLPFFFLPCLQRLTSVSRTHIETGIYFRWDDPDADSASSSLSTLNDARLGSCMYDDEVGVANATGSQSEGLDSSSTDGNNNNVSHASEQPSSMSSQHISGVMSPPNDEVLVSSKTLAVNFTFSITFRYFNDVNCV